MAVFALPLVRSYFFYGAGDSMTHLGWARELRAGTGTPFGFIYPAVHMLAVFLTDLSGFDLTYTMQFVPLVVFPLLSIVFVTLCVQYLTDSAWGLPIGVATGLLLLPVNNLSIHLLAHPSSQAVLYFSFVLYLVFRFVTDRSDGFALATSTGIALAIACVAIVFVHPQEAMSLVVLLGTIAAVQFGYRRFRPTDRIARHKPLYAHTLLTFLVFASWLPQHDRPIARILFVVSQFQQVGVTAGAETTDTQVASLTALGGSVEELFVKILGVTLIFCLFAAALMGTNLLGRLNDYAPDQTALITYLTVGLVPLGFIFLAVFAADQGDHYFRFMGFIMMPVAMLAATGIATLASKLDGAVSRTTVATGLVIFLTVAIAMQAAVIHSSPYYYQSNGQVTESSVEGYSVAFDHRVEDTVFISPRDGPRRYVDIYFGRPTANEGLDFPETGVRGEVFNTNISTHYDSDRYLAIREANYEREVGLYDGLRYREEGFEALEQRGNIYRVQDNGEFRLYLISSEAN